MIKAYWISLYTQINNQENLKKYAEIVTPIIKKYGGKPLVRGGKNQAFDGDNFLRTVIWEFPNYKKALECHESKEYQAGWSLAKDTTKRHMQIIEGFSTE
tara:strand:- start:1506 stop:1805 length:300 start_codon:yes stop_codon:yes gene_type:complete